MEIYKDIPGYEGYYQVSNLGNVKSLPRILIRNNGRTLSLKERILTPSLDTPGYRFVILCRLGKRRNYKISQLVAMAFLNHKRNGFNIVVDHINNVKTDDRLENLQLLTNRENCSKNRVNGSSKYVGVCWDKSRKKWIATIQINGGLKNLGRFNTELQAHEAYQNKLLTLNQ